MEYADRGDVGERLRDLLVFRAERFRGGREKVEGTDHFGPESHGQRRHRLDAEFPGVGSKTRPARAHVIGQAAVHRDSSAVCVQARAFVVLKFEELNVAHPFARGRDVVQRPVPVGKHDARFGRVDELDTTFRKPMQELDDVVFVDDRVRELDERL